MAEPYLVDISSNSWFEHTTESPSTTIVIHIAKLVDDGSEVHTGR